MARVRYNKQPDPHRQSGVDFWETADKAFHDLAHDYAVLTKQEAGDYKNGGAYITALEKDPAAVAEVFESRAMRGSDV